MRTLIFPLALVLGSCGVGPAVVPRTGLPTYPPAASTETRPQESILPLEVVVGSSPQLARAGGRWYAVYELHLTNFYSAPVSIEEILATPVRGAPSPQRTYSGDLLERNLKVIGPRVDSIPARRILPGRRAVLFAWVPIASPAGAPDSIQHTITARIAASSEPQVIIGGEAALSSRLPVIIDPPLRGDGWLSYYGACPDAVSAHDQLAYPRAGRIRFPQRFAVDFVKFGADGRVFTGDASRNESYHAFGQPVHAVADGVVLLTINDVEENVPPDVTVRMTRHSVAGNLVVLDIGGGLHAVYGHLRHGSVRVAPGHRVRRGEIIAEVGNTGNSTGAHLHFHIIDAPSAAAGEGMGFRYREYGLISDTPIPEAILDDGGVWKPGPWTAVEKNLDLPTCGSVVRFP